MSKAESQSGNKITFTKKKFLGYTQVWEVIADRLDPDTLALYYVLKSVESMNGKGEGINLSIRQLQTAMKIGDKRRVKRSIEKLVKHEVITIEQGGKYRNSRKLILRDDELAIELDPELDYWRIRHKLWTE